MPREHSPTTAAGLLLALSQVATTAAALQPSASPPGDLLDHLTGRWVLRGTMGQTELHQQVEAEWVVQGQYLRMHMLDAEPPAEGQTPYEAVYMLGYDEEAGEYIFHLFDTYGAAYTRTIGVGIRTGDSIRFLFDYPGGLFANTFTWYPEAHRWEMTLEQQSEDGTWTRFATKTLTRP